MTENRIENAMAENAIHLASAAASRAAKVHAMIERVDTQVSIRDTLVDLLASVVMTVSETAIAEGDEGVQLATDVLNLVRVCADEDEENTQEH